MPDGDSHTQSKAILQDVDFKLHDGFKEFISTLDTGV